MAASPALYPQIVRSMKMSLLRKVTDVNVHQPLVTVAVLRRNATLLTKLDVVVVRKWNAVVVIVKPTKVINKEV